MESNMEIRAATLADLPAILQIEQACPAAAHWSESQYGKAVAGPGRLVLVAETGGRVAGFLVASTATQEWELENIAVGPAARRQGIGRALIGRMLAEAKNRGVSTKWTIKCIDQV